MALENTNFFSLQGHSEFTQIWTFGLKHTVWQPWCRYIPTCLNVSIVKLSGATDRPSKFSTSATDFVRNFANLKKMSSKFTFVTTTFWYLSPCLCSFFFLFKIKSYHRTYTLVGFDLTTHRVPLGRSRSRGKFCCHVINMCSNVHTIIQRRTF
jgi:hypothetical protein